MQLGSHQKYMRIPVYSNIPILSPILPLQFSKSLLIGTLIFKFLFIYLFLALLGLMHWLSLVETSQSYSLQCTGFLLWWLLLLWSTGSRHSGLQQFRPRGSRGWVQLLIGLWNLPGPGTESVFPALAGRFFSTDPSCVLLLSRSQLGPTPRPHALQPAKLLCPWSFSGQGL